MMTRIPVVVASFLKLLDVASSSGHSMRRSSVTLLVGGSSTVTEGHIEDSLSIKIKVVEIIQVGTSKQEEIFGETSGGTTVPSTIEVFANEARKDR
jgi:hypothetical protein